MGEASYDSESIVIITEDELTLLIISSTDMLKRNYKSGRLEVYNLVQESNLVEFKISSEVFTETFFFFFD